MRGRGGRQRAGGLRLRPSSGRAPGGPGSPRWRGRGAAARCRAVRPEAAARRVRPAPERAQRFGCPLTRPWAHKGLLGAPPRPSLPVAAKLMSPRQVAFTARPGSSRVENEPGAAPEAPTRRRRPPGGPEAGEVEARAGPPSALHASPSAASRRAGRPQGDLLACESVSVLFLTAPQTPQGASQQHRPGGPRLLGSWLGRRCLCGARAGSRVPPGSLPPDRRGQGVRRECAPEGEGRAHPSGSEGPEAGSDGRHFQPVAGC